MAIVLEYTIQPMPKWMRNTIEPRNYPIHIKDAWSLGKDTLSLWEDTSSLETVEEMSEHHENMRTS